MSTRPRTRALTRTPRRLYLGVPTSPTGYESADLTLWLAAEPGAVAFFDADSCLTACSAGYAAHWSAQPADLRGLARTALLAQVAPAAACPTDDHPWHLDLPGTGLRYHAQPLHTPDGALRGWRDGLEPAALPLGEAEQLAFISHELRNPLTAMVGHCEALRASLPPLGPEIDEQLATIGRNAAYLLQMLSNLLNTARLQAGALQPTYNWIDPSSLLADALATVEPQLSARALPPVVTIDPDLPDFRGDAVHIRQILVNLLSNAAKYAPDGPLELCATLEGSIVRFALTDHGPGLTTEQQALVFQPFYRVAGSAARTPSTGLGLAISRWLAEMLGGSLNVESQYGLGASFILELPLLPTPVSRPSAPPLAAG